MSMLFKRIKDWATTITAFRTGDVIPVDGPSGTAKMSKDDLLRVTAENAVDSGVVASTEAVGNYHPNFELGGIYFNPDTPWSEFSTNSRIRMDILSTPLPKAHKGGKIHLTDYTHAEIYIGYVDANGGKHNVSWRSSDFVFPEDCTWAVSIKYMVAGVESEIPDHDVSVLSSLFVFEDSITNENLFGLVTELKGDADKALDAVGLNKPNFQIGGVYYEINSPWAYVTPVKTSRVNNGISGLPTARRGAKIGLKSYTNAEFYVGWIGKDGVHHVTGWKTADYTFPQDCEWGVSIKYMVAGVESEIPNIDPTYFDDLFFFEDVIVNDNLYERTKNVVSFNGMVRTGRLNSSTGKYEAVANDAVSSLEGVFYKVIGGSTSITFNCTNPAGKSLRARVAWFKADGTSLGTSGTYASATNSFSVPSGAYYFAVSFIVWDTASNASTKNISPSYVDGFAITCECEIAEEVLLDRKTLDTIPMPYRYSGEPIHVNKWGMAERLSIPLTSELGASCQSMAIVGDYLVVLARDGGSYRGGVFSMSTMATIGKFTLPHTGLESPHCNMCSAKMDGSDIIIYTDQWDGEKLCLVYRLDHSVNFGTAIIVQTIGSTSDNQGLGPRDWSVDFSANRIYSIGYKLNSDSGDKNTNTSYVSAFELPALNAGDVTFTNADVLDNFEVALPTSRQDAETTGYKMYLGYGLGTITETGICVLNLVSHEIETNIDFNVMPSAQVGETEGIAFSDVGDLYMMWSASNSVKRIFFG